MSETEKALTELAGLIESGGLSGKRPFGGSRYIEFPASPTFAKVTIQFESFRRITGLFASNANVAVTKSSTLCAGTSQGLIGDGAGNVLNAPLDISAGMIIYAGAPSASQPVIVGLNIPVQPAEQITVSKNQANIVVVHLFFDYE